MVKTTVAVEGMKCKMCEKHVNDAIRESFQVESVESSHESCETVIVSREALDAEAVKRVIAEQDFTPGQVTVEEL